MTTPPMSLDICVYSPTHLIKRPELAFVTGLFIKPVSQTQIGEMEPDPNQTWRKWFPGCGFFELLKYECMLSYLVCPVLVVSICFVNQMLQLRQGKSLSCCLEVCLNCFNLIGGQHLPAAVTLHVYAEYKTSFWSSQYTLVCMSESICPTTAFQLSRPPQPHPPSPFSHDTVYEMVCSSC